MKRFYPPRQGWPQRKSNMQFAELLLQYEDNLRRNITKIRWTHDVVVAGGRDNSLQNRQSVFYCGEAAYLDCVVPHMRLACFWSGLCDVNHLHYMDVPHAFILWPKPRTLLTKVVAYLQASGFTVSCRNFQRGQRPVNKYHAWVKIEGPDVLVQLKPNVSLLSPPRSRGAWHFLTHPLFSAQVIAAYSCQ